MIMDILISQFEDVDLKFAYRFKFICFYLLIWIDEFGDFGIKEEKRERAREKNVDLISRVMEVSLLSKPCYS